MNSPTASSSRQFVTRVLQSLRRYGLLLLGLILWGLFGAGLFIYHSAQADIARAFGDGRIVLDPNFAVADAEEAIRRGQIRFYLLGCRPPGVANSDYHIAERHPCAEVGFGGCLIAPEDSEYAVLFNQRILKHLHQ